MKTNLKFKLIITILSLAFFACEDSKDTDSEIFSTEEIVPLEEVPYNSLTSSRTLVAVGPGAKHHPTLDPKYNHFYVNKWSKKGSTSEHPTFEFDYPSTFRLNGPGGEYQRIGMDTNFIYIKNSDDVEYALPIYRPLPHGDCSDDCFGRVWKRTSGTAWEKLNNLYWLWASDHTEPILRPKDHLGLLYEIYDIEDDFLEGLED